MDALPTADDLLAQIPMESMEVLLTSLQPRAHPLGSYIPNLQTDAPAVSPPQTLPLQKGDVVEIQGPAASGKSHLIYHLLATCVLPPSCNSTTIGGWARAAVLVDADGKFSIKRFRHLLLARLSRCLPVTSGLSASSSEGQSPEELVTQCLARLHVFRPRSSAQVATTLMHLPEYHATHPSLKSEEIGLVAVDSLSAFYWNDRFLAEQWRSSDKSASAGPTEPVSPMRQITIALQRIRTLRGPLTVLANWGLNVSRESVHAGEAYPLYKQHLHPFPSPFDDSATITSPSRPRGGTTRLHSSPGLVSSHLARGVESSEPPFSPQHGQEFAITHHITLFSMPSFLCALLPTSSVVEDTVSGPGTAPNNILQGFLRTAGNLSVTRFAFRITEDDILFDPPE